MNDYWICIIKSKGEVPQGYDFDLRQSLKRSMVQSEVAYDFMFSGWGLPEQFADKLMRVLSMESDEGRNALMDWLCQNKVGGIIREDDDMPLQGPHKEDGQEPEKDGE